MFAAFHVFNLLINAATIINIISSTIYPGKHYIHSPVFPAATNSCFSGLADPGLPHGPGPVPPGHPDMSPHHR